LKKKFLNGVKQTLLNEKKERLKKTTARPEIDTDGDEVDVIQGNIQIDLHNQFVILNDNRLTLIEEALNRIKDGSYGICVDCEENIAEKRLLANPYCLTCISCAEDREEAEKRKRI
jgi:RNA polymerase-binding transcription factor